MKALVGKAPLVLFWSLACAVTVGGRRWQDKLLPTEPHSSPTATRTEAILNPHGSERWSPAALISEDLLSIIDSSRSPSMEQRYKHEKCGVTMLSIDVSKETGGDSLPGNNG